MSETYVGAVFRKVPGAFLDVLLVAGITLFPILIGRIALVVPASPHFSKEGYWDFLTNGQIAFYSIGIIAAILIAIFDEKIPKVFGKVVLFGCVAALFFLATLVGIDPALRSSSFSFVGSSTLIVYILALLTRTIVDAVKKVDEKEARDAGRRATQKTVDGLRARKGAKDA